MFDEIHCLTANYTPITIMIICSKDNVYFYKIQSEILAPNRKGGSYTILKIKVTIILNK